MRIALLVANVGLALVSGTQVEAVFGSEISHASMVVACAAR